MEEINLKHGPNPTDVERQLYGIHEQYVSADDALTVVRFLRASVYTSPKRNFTFMLKVRRI